MDVGEASFDGLFTVDPPARRATVRWRFEPAARALDAAVRILSFVRKAPPYLKFRKNE